MSRYAVFARAVELVIKESPITADRIAVLTRTNIDTARAWLKILGDAGLAEPAGVVVQTGKRGLKPTKWKWKEK